jgi:pimeloyl-ACP methyl ester carboxylesterase
VTERSERAKVGLLSLGVGLAAAGVGAALGVAAERVAVGRPLLPARGDRDGDGEAYGDLHSRAQVVIADDGTRLHVEVDEPASAADPQVTIVFSHGYALTMDSWYFQRKALREQDGHRLVFWDQRGHGRSQSGPAGTSTIDQLGADLARVIEAVAPKGPLILVGHSMGGMTVMSLAAHSPHLFAKRVIGTALVSTSAGGMTNVDLGLARLGKLILRLAPHTVRVLTRTPRLVEHGRRIGSDLEMVLVRRYSYATPVSPALVRFTAEMIASTRLDVISDFLPTLTTHDKRAALAAMDDGALLVIVGDSDLMTPADHSSDIVSLLPRAEHIVVERGGHLLMLEHPDVVTVALADLIERSVQGSTGKVPRIRRAVPSLRRRRRSRGGSV